MKRMKILHVILLLISLLFANVEAKEEQAVGTKKDTQITIEKIFLSKYAPFVAAGIAFCIISGLTYWKYSADQNPSKQTISDEDAHSFAQEFKQLLVAKTESTLRGVRSKNDKEDVIKSAIALRGIKDDELEQALQKMESLDVIDPCLQPFIKEYFSQSSFQPLASKYQAIFNELQKGNIPSIITKNDLLATQAAERSIKQAIQHSKQPPPLQALIPCNTIKALLNGACRTIMSLRKGQIPQALQGAQEDALQDLQSIMQELQELHKKPSQ